MPARCCGSSATRQHSGRPPFWDEALGSKPAMSVALIYLFANLIGLGLGPVVAGALSDLLRPTVGEESLRYSMIILSPGLAWSAWHLWAAGRHVTAGEGICSIMRAAESTSLR